MKINCVIIDDEPLAIRVIENHLKEFHNIVTVATFNNPIEALPTLKENKIDVIFLDINMSKMNGLDFLKSIVVKPSVIITTAYREYAAESYDLNVLDYLVKPIPFPRFLKSINKLTQQLYLNQNTNLPSNNENSYIFLKVDKKLVKIKYLDILFIESLKDYIQIYTNSENYIVHKSLTSITEELPSKKFIRVHRSYTIAIDKVDTVEGNSIEIGNKRISIGRKYINQTKKIILNTTS